VDLHIRRIARSLGLTGRNQADWKMACEITARLRELDPDDPVKYDFSLCHLGISEGCDGKSEEPCITCMVAPVCSGPARKPDDKRFTTGD
jgi:endonuclease III